MALFEALYRHCYRSPVYWDDLTELHVRILDTKVRSTQRKDITMVKVLWANNEHEAATWETKTSMRTRTYFRLLKLRGFNFLRGVEGNRNFMRINR